MIVHKTIASNGEGLEFVLSDATVDRIGDIVEPTGWDLKSFKQNPIALFGHNSSFPIGTWKDIRIKGSQLVARLQLASRGTSARIDELISLVEQGILRAVSVGFMPIASEPIDKNDPFGGQRYTKQELLETSLVSVPANPAAIALARSLHLSDETLDLAFGKQAVRREVLPLTGKQAATIPKPERPMAMKTLSQRIEDAQKRLLELRDTLTAQIEKAGDEPDDTDMTVTDELNLKIASAQRSLDQLQEAEKQLASQAVERSAAPVVETRRPLAVAPPKSKPGDLIMRSLVAAVVAHATKKNAFDILVDRYGSDGRVDDGTRAVFNIVTRAASAPADTTTSGWASQLVETQVADFMQLLIPASVYPGLSSRGLRLNFGRSGVISIPSRVATPTIAGAFVAQGAPIPVKQGAFTSIPLTPKKMAVISTFTREIAEHSTPAIEGLIRNAMQEDTSVALDTILLDATAATTTRPAGILAGVSAAPTTPTAGGGFAALIGDIKAMVGALVTSTNGNLRSPVWLMNPVQQISISLTQNAGGDFPFKAEINNNTLQGYPVIVSSTVPAAKVILIDAADFVSVEGDSPRFDVSDQATLHMEDTAPLAIGTAGTPNTVAAPVRSLWQTDSIGLRMMMDVNWALRRTGVVTFANLVTW
jgi:HK97 family phage major capsid protein/HK97 family phage prohead protease